MLIDLQVNLDALQADLVTHITMQCDCMGGEYCRECHGLGVRDQRISIYAVPVGSAAYGWIAGDYSEFADALSVPHAAVLPVWGQAMLNRLSRVGSSEFVAAGEAVNTYDNLVMLGQAAASMEVQVGLVGVDCLGRL